MYMNFDNKNKKQVMNALGIQFIIEKSDPKTPSEYLDRMDFYQKCKDEKDYISYWNYVVFEINFFDHWLRMAYNNNPQYFLEKLSDDLLKLFKKSRIKNYGSVHYWGKFWKWLQDHSGDFNGMIETQRELLVEEIIVNFFKY